MGGNALKTVKTSRIDQQSYFQLKLHIMEQLRKDGFVLTDIIEVPNKESYGDLDLLYFHPDNQDIKIKVIELFSPQEIVSNGDVLSFDFKTETNEYFQIDLIKCNSINQINFARFYFSYGDLGSILGRFCNYHGVKIGHRGFWIDVYENTMYPDRPHDPTRNIGEILLTT